MINFVIMLLVWLFFIGGGLLIGWLISLCIPSFNSDKKTKPPTYIYHNTITEHHNHLHITKEDLKNIIDN